MADETTLDPDGARRLFTVVGAITDDLQAALNRVQSIRSTMPEPWGTDIYGERFSNQHEPAAEAALDYVNKAIGFVRDMSVEGKGAVEEFVKTDGDNADGLGPKS